MLAHRHRTLRVLAPVAALLLAALPLPLRAQEDGGTRVFTFSTGRPRIGVLLEFRADKERDRLGARIQSVTPDGPAAKAGLREGDIITRFQGTALGGVGSDDEDESGPAQKLIELARKLEPGDTVEVEYRRDSESRKAKIVARDLSAGGMARGFRMTVPPGAMHLEEGLPRMPMVFEGGPAGNLHFFGGEAFGELHLTDLNPELGEYFGAKTGVLVLETPGDSTLPLKAGDVILAIDGRAPTSETHARRILRSYDGGETAKLDILRKQKKLSVSWKVPERELKWKEPKRRTKEKVKVERS